MSYYDFDDHFWAPYEVCPQVTQKEMTVHPFMVVKEWLQVIISNTFYGEKMARFEIKNND